MSKDQPTLKEQLREYYMLKRRSMIADLGAVEDLLGLPRSIIPRTEREKEKVQPEGQKEEQDGKT